MEIESVRKVEKGMGPKYITLCSRTYEFTKLILILGHTISKGRRTHEISLFQISWISLVVYIFYSTFIFYLQGRQFYYLRQVLGVSISA